jgi:uncharacterized protein (TIRG00374 family)
MSSRLKTIAQYLLILGVTFFLVYFSLQGIHVAEGEDKWDFLLKKWQSADKLWLFIMAAIALLSHALRAERWRVLMEPTGHQSKFSYSFLSLMVGYLVNIAVPRGGELSRCYNLYKLDKTPVEVSFGTVVVERLVDVLCLLVLIGMAFAAESSRLFEFIRTLPIGEGDNSIRYLILAAIFVVAVLVIIITRFIVRRNARLKELIRNKWMGLREGLMSIFTMRRKGLFFFYSLTIWFLYFLMSYATIQAFPETHHLGFTAVLSLFAIGSIAMAAPTPGGAGSYHMLVPQGLTFLYAIPKNDAVGFTVIFHGWQTLIMIVFGVISIIATSLLVKRNSASAS